ncbi:MAG TPA: efflux RND transporter periplasmic adaptor subunit [Gemmataceae bacterium]|nr:efflux RND transporter periplasmic adaptor subunit [Gemmataceae bacterium]
MSISAGLVGCSQSPPTQTPSGTAAPAATFTVVRPEKKALPKTIEQPGTVRAFEEAPLHAKLAGFVTAVKADIGDRVEAGAVLAELGIPELEDEGRMKAALVDRARAHVEQAKKQVTIAEANVVVAEAQTAEAAAGVRRADAVYARWESEARRVGEMVRTRVVDPQTGDETTNQFRAAEAARDEARARGTASEKLAVKAKAELGKATEDVKAAEADERVAAAEAARLKSLLGYRQIKAPFAGTVTRRAVDPGHFVQAPGGSKAEPLFTVVRVDTVRVPVEVPEADAALVRNGAKAAVRVPALRGAEFTGTVSRSAGALDSAARTLRTEIDLPNPEGTLRPGMFATVRIVCEMPPAWVLPAAAVLKQADQTVVYLARDGKAVRLPVRPGRTDGTFTEVFQKQKAGGWEDWTGSEPVLAGPIATLSDGQEVPVGGK